MKEKKELLDKLKLAYEEMEKASDNLKNKQSDYFSAQAKVLDYENPIRVINVQS